MLQAGQSMFCDECSHLSSIPQMIGSFISFSSPVSSALEPISVEPASSIRDWKQLY